MLQEGHAIGGTVTAVDGMTFLQHLTSLDPASWASAWAEGIKEDEKKGKALDATLPAAKKGIYLNRHQTGGTPPRATETTYKKHDDGMYSISLRLPSDLADGGYD